MGEPARAATTNRKSHARPVDAGPLKARTTSNRTGEDLVVTADGYEEDEEAPSSDLREGVSLRSPGAWAAVRRIEMAALAAHVEALPVELDDAAFALHAERITRRLHEAIGQLGAAERVEGNTLLILDQILETWLNDARGVVYRNASARDGVAALLKRLAVAECVTPEDARSSYRALKQVGLNPSAPLTLHTKMR